MQKMNQLSKSICGWQTVLIGLLVSPVFALNAQLFEPSQHHSNLIFPIQFPRYISFHQQHAPTNNAKSLETLNSKEEILSSNDDSNHNVMVNAEKPVDAMHKMQRIEQLQQKQEPAIDLDAKNKNAFFDEDGNKMRPHGQQGNVLSTQFMDGNAAMMVKNPSVTPMAITGNNRNNPKSISFAEQLLNNLAAHNVAVNFSQSISPSILLPFDPQGTQFSLDTSTSKKHIRINDKRKVLRSSFATVSYPPQVIIINGPTRIYGAGTESKFPPFLEFFVQRIQKYFSVYKYEDLSRPGLTSQVSSDADGNLENDVEIEAEQSDNVVEVTTETQMKQTPKINSFRLS